MQPHQLHCEYQENPIGIDQCSPRLSWQYPTEKSSFKQTAYQICVEDTWDSGKVNSSDSIQNFYLGKALESNKLYKWKVRVWDQQGQCSDWSSWATFRMGFISPKDWTAKWIKSPANCIEKDQPVLKTAQWIWSATEKQEPLPSPPGSWTFSKTFEVNTEIKKATLSLAADSIARIELNNIKLDQTEHWQRGIQIDCTKSIQKGQNKLCIEVDNISTCEKIAGVICGLEITFRDGTQKTIVSDKSWSSCKLDTEDTFYTHELTPWGEGPWGRHIYFDQNRHIAQPIFSKSFDLDKVPTEAITHISGAGQFQLLLNDQQVGDSLIDPPWSVYEKTRYYRSFDIKNFLKTGNNEIRIIMGKGFYNSIGDRIVHHTHRWGEVMAIFEAHLQFSDGEQQSICSDKTWQVGHGPLTHDTMLGGCDYDSRYEKPQELHTALETETPATLRQAESPPMKGFESLPPIKDIEEPEDGVYVYDFGQNLSALPKLKIKGKSGQRIRMTPAEQRHGQTDRKNNGTGLVDQAGVGSPNYFDYTLSGNGSEYWQPPCTYSGFQYLQVEGAVPAGAPNPNKLPVIETLESLHIRSSVSKVGAFSCSNELWNKIDEIIDRAVRSNLAHVLTDCPTREKLGWLEVPYLMGPSISRQYDLSRFYAKITRDIRDTQGSNGTIYTTAPSYATFDPNHRIGYTLEWGAAGVVLPWQLYRWYGDARILQENYCMMKSFVNYIHDTSTDLVPKPGLGDWFDYGHGQARGASKFTPPELTAMATFYRCTSILSKTALVLNDKEAHQQYTNLAKNIHQGFNKEFYCGNGEYKNYGSPQTANAMALSLNLCPEDDQRLTLEVLLKDLKERSYQQTAGDVGFHYLIETLSHFNCHDVVSTMLNRRDEGSYGFSIDRGWTALPEAWEAATKESMNHCMLGHAHQWFSHELIGIHQEEESIAFENIIIKPAFVDGVTWAKGHYDSIRGRISSGWTNEKGQIKLNVDIPPNSKATIHLPCNDKQKIWVNKTPIDQSHQMQLSKILNGIAVLTCDSGSFEVICSKNFN